MLDLLLEEALAQAGVAPDRKAEYTIALKQGLARAGSAGPTQFPAATWHALMAAYAETVEIPQSRPTADPTRTRQEHSSAWTVMASGFAR